MSSHEITSSSPRDENCPLVELRSAGRRTRDRWLVRGVNLTVRPGEIVTLVGPNGSGKSTTSRLALGLVAPSEGQALRRAGLRVATMPQKLNIDWSLPLTVERFMNLTAKKPKRTIEAALGRTGVVHLGRSQVRDLSGGEFQRVMLARCIATQPDLLVLDEPVQGVDPAGEVALYKLIADLRDELGVGILLISHDLHLVMAATDHVLCLNGHVCCEGSPVSVAANREYQQLLGPGAAGALAYYNHQHDDCNHDHDHKHGDDHAY